MREIDAHPDAAIFPMMSEDELAELAEDIKENGLRHSIIIGKHEGREVIVDGRNRFAACEMAGVEPRFEQLNGHDPKAFILSMNVKRRHMTASQRAMATAVIYPEATAKGGRGKKLYSEDTVSRQLIMKARTVLGTEFVTPILEGNQSLNEAYDKVRLRTGKINNEASRLAKLRETSPDLADMVVAQQMTLDEAIAREKAEIDAIKQRRWAATKNLIEGVQLLDRAPETIRDVVAQYDAAIAEQLGETITPERLRRVGSFVENLARYIEEMPERWSS